MFKLVPIEKRVCELGSSYDIIANACGIKEENCIFLDCKLQLSKFWRGDADPYIYLMFALIMGVIAMMYNIYKFNVVYFSKQINPPSRWNMISFFSVPPLLAKRFDLLKLFLQINTAALLLYSATYDSPLHQYPWLLIQVLEMFFKTIAVTINYILRKSTGRRFWRILNLSFHALSTWIVYKVLGVLFAARKNPPFDYLEMPINSNDSTNF